jgi:alkaline phosphatase
VDIREVCHNKSARGRLKCLTNSSFLLSSSGGNDILSFGGFSHQDELAFFTLSYANGVGFSHHINGSGRVDPMGMNYDDVEFMQPAAVPLYEETHGGDDVGVFALGPYAHLFTGVYEQHYIAHAMMYATCLGPEDFLKAPGCSVASKINLSAVAVAVFIVACLLH